MKNINRRMIKVVFLLLVTLLFGGCATVPLPPSCEAGGDWHPVNIEGRQGESEIVSREEQ